MFRTYEGIKQFKGDSKTVHDALVVESPLAILWNGVRFSITMQTPGNEVALAFGLLHAEGYLKGLQMHQVECLSQPNELGSIEEVNLICHQSANTPINHRTLLSVASCGICGQTQLNIPSDQALPNGELVIPTDAQWEQFQRAQNLFEQSGGSHAAALFDAEGKILNAFEDIGRHNAVDKCVGDLWMNNQLQDAQLLMVSGRISYEIIAKCFVAKIPSIAAVSAPSSMAVDFAKEWGIALWGFCREGRKTRYA